MKKRNKEPFTEPSKDKIAVCSECGSEFLKASSHMAGLCPECAHILYSYPNCSHVFKNGRCIYCYWNGKKSRYIKRMKS